MKKGTTSRVKNSVGKKKLLIVTTTFPRWENDTDPPFVFELSKRLVDSFEVVVHTPHYYGSCRKETISGVGVYRFRYFFSRFEKLAGGTAILPFLKRNKFYLIVLPFFLLAQLCSLYFLIKRVKPDVIHAHWLIPTGLFAVLCREKCPVVVTGHGADIFGLSSGMFSWFKKVTLLKSQGITVVSKSLAEQVRPLLPESRSVEVLPMGVDDGLFSTSKRSENLKQSINPNGFILLYVGRLTEKKGVGFLLDAFEKVVRRQDDLVLVVVGDGEEKQALLDLAENLDIADKVVFTGALPNEKLPPYYAVADIFIGPSIVAVGGDTEGFGLTFMEASFSGCLLIGSRVGGISDIIEDGVTGLLVEPGDSTELAFKIRWSLENWDTVLRLKEIAYLVHMEKFSWNVIMSKYTKVFTGVMEASQRMQHSAKDYRRGSDNANDTME